MQHGSLRVLLVLALLALAISIPLISSGYSELHQAAEAKTYHEIAQHYWSAAQRIPWRGDAYELAGHAYYHDRDYVQADAAYQRAYSRRALSPDGWVAWGDVYYLQSDPVRATEIWEQALTQRNPSEKLYSRLSQIYKENGDYSKAADYLQRYVSLHLEDASAHYRLGLLLTLTDPNQALTELINASELDPQFDPVVETLRSALNLASISDSDAMRLVLTGRGLALVNEWDLARLSFESAVEADATNAEAWAWLGEAKQQSAEDGSAEIARAYQLDRNSSIVRGLRGLYFQRTGNFREALSEFQAAARSDDRNPAWQVSIGESYSKLGDLISALNAYRTATQLAPQDASYWRMLALFCAQNNVNISDVGVPAAQKAAILARDDSASLDLFGWLLVLDGQHEDAKKILLRAVELDPQNGSAQYHLGLLYLQKGDRTLAYSHFVSARDLGNSDAQSILDQYFP